MIICTHEPLCISCTSFMYFLYILYVFLGLLEPYFETFSCAMWEKKIVSDYITENTANMKHNACGVHVCESLEKVSQTEQRQELGLLREKGTLKKWRQMFESLWLQVIQGRNGSAFMYHSCHWSVWQCKALGHSRMQSDFLDCQSPLILFYNFPFLSFLLKSIRILTLHFLPSLTAPLMPPSKYFLTYYYFLLSTPVPLHIPKWKLLWDYLNL